MTAVGNLLTSFAKRTKIAVLLVVHVTKDGDLSGPRTLEHLVDDVVRFDPFADYGEAFDGDDPIEDLRVLASTAKMRNGPSNVRAVLRMTASGLEAAHRSMSVAMP